MKRPSLQFYPADWRKDPNLSICSLAAKGLWIELLCILHESEQYGFLTVNGKPMSHTQVARLVGETPNALKRLLDELEEAKVFSRDDKGAIFCRRMVRDEDVRNARASGGAAGKEYGILGAEHGSKGGRKAGKKTNVRGQKIPPLLAPQIPPLNPPPSSSSSSSSSSSERERSAPAQPALPDEWEDFSDSMPTEAAKDFHGMSNRINSLHPSWARRPHFTAQELRDLQANSRVFFDLTDADWALLTAYMAAAVPSDWGIKLWQPDIRGRFLTSVTDVLSHADNWKRECKKRGVSTGIEGGAK